MLSFTQCGLVKKGRSLLCDVSFVIEAGESVAITGKSGAGKSTVLALAVMKEIPTTGTVRLFDANTREVNAVGAAMLRQKCGVIFQDYRLLPHKSAWENIAFALEIVGKPQKEIDEKVARLLDSVGLTEKADLLPEELSGGQQQRVAIARSLAHDPDIIFADEPTGNLDTETGEDIIELLQKINAQGITLVVATHDERILSALCRRSIHLEHGRLIRDTKA